MKEKLEKKIKDIEGCTRAITIQRNCIKIKDMKLYERNENGKEKVT